MFAATRAVTGACPSPTNREHEDGIRQTTLFTYGPNDLYRTAATHVDKIVKGAVAGDLPVEQPSKFDFVVNLKTTKALALTIPQSLLLRAGEVIQ